MEQRYIGHEDQLLKARRVMFRDGLSEGVRAIELQNRQGLYATCIEDQCLNLFDFSYKGINFAFQSKNGLVSNRFFRGGTNEFLWYWPAGMLFTSGLTNTGPGGLMKDGLYHAEHGRIGMMPATDVAISRDDSGITVTGTVQDALLTGYRLELKRRLHFPAAGKEIVIEDVVTNREPQAMEYALLYHINLGYPLLSPDARVVRGAGGGYDAITGGMLPSDWSACKEPEDHKAEELFCHENTPDKNGFGYVALFNEPMGLGCYVKYDMRTLPLLLHWKNMCSHDYVIGLEPSNNHNMGRDKEREHGTLPVLQGYESATFRVSIGVLDGKEEMDAFETMVNTLK